MTNTTINDDEAREILQKVATFESGHFIQNVKALRDEVKARHGDFLSLRDSIEFVEKYVGGRGFSEGYAPMIHETSGLFDPLPEPDTVLHVDVFTDVLAEHAEQLLNANGYDSVMGVLVHMFAVMQADGAVILPDEVDLGWFPR